MLGHALLGLDYSDTHYSLAVVSAESTRSKGLHAPRDATVPFSAAINSPGMHPGCLRLSQRTLLQRSPIGQVDTGQACAIVDIDHL